MASDGKGEAAPGPGDASTQIAAIVEPIKAGAALVGFAIGFYTAWRAGGAWPEASLHGLLGALMFWMLGWFVGLVLVREAIRARVDVQRAEYDHRLIETKRQIVETLRARGHDVPEGYLEGAPPRRELGSGS